MRKFLQLIRPFRETRNIVALCLAFFLCAGSLWAQTDYSTTYTSGVTLSTTGGTSASDCNIIIGGVTYPGIKVGTGSVAGAVKITVPENTKYLHIHVAGWNGKNVIMSVTPTGYSENIALTSNSGIANNSPFTFNGDASTSEYYKVITFPEALSEDTEFTFTAVSGNRFVIWGVNAEEENLNGPSINASDVELPYDATSGQIEYTLNNPTNDGVLAASTNVDWISDVTISPVASILTFTTTANSYVSQRQGTVTLTYTYGDNQTIMKNVTVLQAGNPNASGTENNPYTVAQARAAIDAANGITGVYATGIVSAIPGAWSTQYSNITFNLVDEAGDEDFLQAFRCASSATADASAVQVGDVVLVYGNLTKYGSTYEFAQGCTLVSLTHSAGFVDAPTFSPASGTYTEPQTVTLSCATEGATIYYTLDGSEPDDESLIYTDPLYISSNTTINAIAYLNGDASNVVTATYTFDFQTHYTWDLTIASYDEITDPAIVTWSSAYATMTNSSESGGTSASNYLGGDDNNRTSSRFYANNTLTITPAAGYAITSLVFSATSEGYANALQGSAWTNATATVEGQTVTVVPTDGLAVISATIGGTCGFTAVTVYYEENNETVIVANDVTVPYDATSGSIDYTINNPVDGGVLTANTTADWLTLQMTPNYAVIFTCEANEETEARTAIVTLTYTYNTTETVSKNVTVTQEAAPAPATVYTTIPELFDAATSTEQPVLVTFDSWIVSGVSTNGKNVYVTDGTNGFVIYSNTDMSETYAAGDILDGEAVACTLKLYNGFAELLNVNPEDLIIISGASELSPAEIAMADLAGVNTGALVSYENLTCSVNNNKYYLSDGTTTLQVYTSLYAFGETLVADHIYNITGVYQQFNDTKEVLPRSAADIEEVANTEPSITVTPATIEAPAEGTEGSLDVNIENILDVISIDLAFCDANGVELEVDPDWVYAAIVEPTPTEGYTVSYTVYPNDGEARTAYFRVSIFTAGEEFYSNIVTVAQDEYVAPPQDYAELPFEFDGGRSDIENTNGLTQEGLESDYAASPKLKFKNTGTWVILHFEGVPGQLSYTIKGNSFADGTFTVQTSVDGETYTDLRTYTEFGTGNASYDEVFPTMDANVRYIKWIYTEKVAGNVGLGNIVLEEISTEPAIVIVEDQIEVGYEGGNGNIAVTYLNMGDAPLAEVEFLAEDGGPAEYDWITTEMDANNGVYYSVEPNDGDARTAYLRVYGINETVTSNIVTITQTAAPQQYTLTVSEFENLEIFTFVDNLDEVALEGAGEIQVTEGASVSLSVSADEGYILTSLLVDGQNVVSELDETGLYTFEMPSHDVTISAMAEENLPGNWVLTSIEDLTENDVFVIVGTKESGSYAMSNDHGTSSSPSAVEVTVVGNTLSGNVPSTIQWNIGFPEDEEGYIFYPNGNDTTWLYCINDNKGIRVGVNEDNVFIINEDYLYNVAKGRYLGVFNGQDWRCYTSIHANIAGMTLGFYKKVTTPVDCDKIVLNEANPSWEVTFENEDLMPTPTRWTFQMPKCWTIAEQYTSAVMNEIGEQADTLPQVYRGFNTTDGGQYSFRMHFRSLVAMPELDEDVDLANVHLSMNVRQPYWSYKLQVGIITDINNPDESFVPVAVVNNPTKSMTHFECGFWTVKDLVGEGRYIAFKNIGGSEGDPYCTNYLDDITLTYVGEEMCAVSLPHTWTFEGLSELSGATGVEPDCWDVIVEDAALESTTKPQVYRGFNNTPDGHYSLRMKNRCIYAMPVLEVIPTNNGVDLTMTLNVRQPNELYRLQVGVLDAQDNFNVVKTIRCNGTSMEEFTVNFSNYTGGRIAFRNTLVPSTGMDVDYYDYSFNYLDDIHIDYTAVGKADGSMSEAFAADRDLENIAVYPNPTTGMLHIDAVDVQKVECYNQMGQLVRVYDNARDIDLGSLSDGVYMLRITMPQGMTMRKVVKR